MSLAQQVLTRLLWLIEIILNLYPSIALKELLLDPDLPMRSIHFSGYHTPAALKADKHNAC